MGAKPVGQVISIATLVIAALFSMSIALQLTDHARERLISHEAEAAAIGWTRQLEHDIGGITNVFEAGTKPKLDALLSRANFSSHVFSYTVSDKTGQTLYSTGKYVRAEAKEQTQSLISFWASVFAEGEEPAGLRGTQVVLAYGDDVELPHYYSVVRIPVVDKGTFAGSITLFSDETGRLTLYKRSFGFLTAGLLIIMALGSALTGSIVTRQISQHRKARDEIRYLAEHDALTGLQNRTSFNEALENAIESGTSSLQDGRFAALIALDIKDFKEINDNFGHDSGDQLLKHVANYLQGSTRSGDVVARMGADEFAMLCLSAESRSDVEKLVESILSKLNTVVSIKDQFVRCEICLGIALYPKAGATAEALTQAADLALYSAKTSVKNTHHCFYEPSMHHDVRSRRDLGQALARAIENSELEVHYQPQVNLDTNEVDAYEALIRWNHPERGTVSPGEFIPIAEENGLIGAIGEWVLRESCMEAATWRRGERIAVNLSAAQFKDDDVLNAVRNALADSGIDPARLELEITESLLFHDPEHALGTLSALKSLGVKLAMDDFGTGYSSLAHLWRFPFDKIKIDQSFVKNVNQDPKVAKIITSIIDLGRALDISITAEGVEQASQAQFLRDRSCDLVQGYFYGRPSPNVNLKAENATADSAIRTGVVSKLLEVLGTLDSTQELSPEAGGKILEQLVKIAQHSEAKPQRHDAPSKAAADGA